MRLGANYEGDGSCFFSVWAPFRESVKVAFPEKNLKPLAMQKDEYGYWSLLVHEVSPGDLYLFQLDGNGLFPDPASNSQPLGVNGPSEVVDHEAFPWGDETWKGISLEKLVFYELHIGTFTPEGTFSSAIERVRELARLGINAFEVMPVGQFPGKRNWGYDGVFPFAVQSSYGGPVAFKSFVEACHECGTAVFLDVVYNHLGPEGNVLGQFGPYESEVHRVPWGKSMNLDGEWSYGTREFFLSNAEYWLDRYHIDGLRLDAVHALYDFGARPFLRELQNRVRLLSGKTGWERALVAESDLNDTRLVLPPETGGYGLDGQWCDDFHHSLHALLTGENQGYYLDYRGREDLKKSLMEGFVLDGRFSEFRRTFHGVSSREIPPTKLIVFSQNHDQVGNRFLGERLSSLVSFEKLKVSAGLVLLSPYIPLLFMGEEYAEEAPFPYFTSHEGSDLAEAVRSGRKKEFERSFPRGEPPDPQDPNTFESAILDHEKQKTGNHFYFYGYVRTLIDARRRFLVKLDRGELIEGETPDGVFCLLRKGRHGRVALLLNLSDRKNPIDLKLPGQKWELVLDSSSEIWGGPGSFMEGFAKNSLPRAMQPWSLALAVQDRTKKSREEWCNG